MFDANQKSKFAYNILSQQQFVINVAMQHMWTCDRYKIHGIVDEFSQCEPCGIVKLSISHSSNLPTCYEIGGITNILFPLS